MSVQAIIPRQGKNFEGEFGGGGQLSQCYREWGNQIIETGSQRLKAICAVWREAKDATRQPSRPIIAIGFGLGIWSTPMVVVGQKSHTFRARCLVSPSILLQSAYIRTAGPAIHFRSHLQPRLFQHYLLRTSLIPSKFETSSASC